MSGDPIFVPCPLCNGSGEECVGTDYGNHFDHPPEPIFDCCHVCDGKGDVETEGEPITIEDLLAEKIAEEEAREEQAAHGQFGVGA